MKKIFFTLFFCLMSSYALAVTVVYRTSSGEVRWIGASDEYTFDMTYHTEIEDPTFTNGTDLQRRVLGSAKIFDNGTVRNATQQEIDTFESYAETDRQLAKVKQVKAFFQNNEQMRKILKAVVKTLVDYINNKTGSSITYQQAYQAILNNVSVDD